MKETAPKGQTDTFGRVSPSASSLPTTVSVSTESYALRFLTGNEVRRVEADGVLTLTDVYEGER